MTRSSQPIAYAVWAFFLIITGFSCIRGKSSDDCSNDTAYEIDGKKTTLESLYKRNREGLYDIDRRRSEIIEANAKQSFLDWYFAQEAKKSGKTQEEARDEFFSKNAKYEEGDVPVFAANGQQMAAEQAEQQKPMIRAMMRREAERKALDELIAKAQESGQLKIFVKTPDEAVYQISITDNDPVRYGPEIADTKPVGCDKDSCPVTIVAYLDYQCPSCDRSWDAFRRVLQDYKGQIRFVMKEFPLPFHQRAMPASIASHCAMQQGKYWEMYDQILHHNSGYEDSDFVKYANASHVDVKTWKSCYENSAPIEEMIQKTIKDGELYGVLGAPTVFVNGHKVEMGPNYEALKSIIEKILRKP